MGINSLHISLRTAQDDRLDTLVHRLAPHASTLLRRGFQRAKEGEKGGEREGKVRRLRQFYN